MGLTAVPVFSPHLGLWSLLRQPPPLPCLLLRARLLELHLLWWLCLLGEATRLLLLLWLRLAGLPLLGPTRCR